jgi:hypothetical protein
MGVGIWMMNMMRPGRGVRWKSWESGVDKHNTTTSADLGLRRGRIHDALLNRRWC